MTLINETMILHNVKVHKQVVDHSSCEPQIIESVANALKNEGLMSPVGVRIMSLSH